VVAAGERVTACFENATSQQVVTLGCAPAASILGLAAPAALVGSRFSPRIKSEAGLFLFRRHSRQPRQRYRTGGVACRNSCSCAFHNFAWPVVRCPRVSSLAGIR